jgi:hypothetical protein
MQRWDGSTWATRAWCWPPWTASANVTMPRAGAVCVTASTPGSTSGSNASNRLVSTAYGTQANAGPGGTQSTPSRVHFSNPGRPHVWETDGDAGVPGTRAPRGRNFIDLTPGDGERIMAAVTWRELVFIFKETKFFVLWGEGIGAEGTPTFQVREVVNDVGLASAQAVSIGRDGVYFMNRRGVYRTSGGDPVLLSDIVSPMWTQDPDVYFKSRGRSTSRGSIASACSGTWSASTSPCPTGAAAANDRVLVYDTQHGWWSLYDWPASALVSFRADVRPAVHFGYAVGPNRIGAQQLDRSDDRGARIVSRWRSGWGDYGNSQVKTIRETKLWGAGAVITLFSTDFNPVMHATEDTILGALADWPVDGAGTWDAWLAPLGVRWPSVGQIANAMLRYATRGTLFSTQFSNSTQAPTWSVHRIARHLREVREPSVR